MLREIFQKKKKKLSIHVEMMIREMTFVCKTYLGKDEKGKKILRVELWTRDNGS